MTDLPLTDDSLLELAQAFLAKWKQIRNIPSGRASAMVGANQIGVLLEDAFTPSELTLAKQESGFELLQRYVEPIVDLISEELRMQIEWSIDCRMITHRVILQVEAGYLIVLFGLSDEAVPIVDPFSPTTWADSICL